MSTRDLLLDIARKTFDRITEKLVDQSIIELDQLIKDGKSLGSYRKAVDSLETLAREALDVLGDDGVEPLRKYFSSVTGDHPELRKELKEMLDSEFPGRGLGIYI